MELEWLLLNKHKRWFHSPRVRFPFVSMSASWLFGVTVFDLNFGVQIDYTKQPIKSNSVGSGNMSHCGTSHLYDHLDHCFAVCKDVQHGFLTRRIRVWGNRIYIVQIINLSKNFLSRWRCRQVSLICLHWFVFPWRALTIRSHKSSAGIPSILKPASKEMSSDSVELCETEVLFLTSSWLERTCGFRKYTMFHLK